LSYGLRPQPRSTSFLADQYLEYLIGRKRATRHLEQIKQAFKEMENAGIVDLTAEDVCLKVERWLIGMTNSADYSR
jgi:hypothetical protein